jgi:hypothetical protein
MEGARLGQKGRESSAAILPPMRSESKQECMELPSASAQSALEADGMLACGSYPADNVAF